MACVLTCVLTCLPANLPTTVYNTSCCSNRTPYTVLRIPHSLPLTTYHIPLTYLSLYHSLHVQACCRRKLPLHYRYITVTVPLHYRYITVTGLLQKDPEKRLGSGESDGAELRAHAWFAPINWTKLLARELKPEFRPNVQVY